MIRKGMETGITIPKHCSHLKSLFKTFSHILCTDIGQQGSTLFFYKLPTIAALHSQDFQKWAVRGPMKNFDLHCCMLVSYSSSSSASSNLGSWCRSWIDTFKINQEMLIVCSHQSLICQNSTRKSSWLFYKVGVNNMRLEVGVCP